MIFRVESSQYNQAFSANRLATILVLDRSGSIQAVTDWQHIAHTSRDWEPQAVKGERPRIIEQLSTDPMDDTIQQTWTKIEYPYDDEGKEKGLGGRIFGYKKLRYAFGADGETATYRAGSHERHNRYRIENRIQTALGELVARHNITLAS